MAKNKNEFHVLIVEDEELIAEMLAEYFALVAPEIKLSFAKSLYEARTLLQKNSFDLCIIDCNLPDGTACDLFFEGVLRCPVVVTTGYVNEQKFGQVKKESKIPLHLLQKPYLPADLYRKVRELLKIKNTGGKQER